MYSKVQEGEGKMQKLNFFLVSVLFTTTLSANEDFNSEIGHFGGGVVLGGALTVVGDYYYPENRALFGFGVSSVGFAIEEMVATAVHGNLSGNLLDIAAHTAGSALGAMITDKYLLMPVISQSKANGNYVGIYTRIPF